MAKRELIVDLSNRREKTMLLGVVRSLQGKFRVEFTSHRPRRSDRQNRYYWPCFVQPFADFLRGQGEMFTDLQAHGILKTKFLRMTFIDRQTDEAMDYVRSTTELDTAEFNVYLDNCANWLADFFGIQIPEPDVYHEKETAATAA